MSGTELRRFATLNDPAYNRIEVIVEKKGDQLCFSHGWMELNKLYDLKYGAAVTLINVKPSRFVIQIKDRFGEEIEYPKYDQPMLLR